MHAVDRENTIVTHDSGSPREQMVAFWECLFPGGYLGWGKTTQLGHGLGLIMGAKLANPDKLCINVMGDASIGMVGMDIETAARNRIGILTIVFNNGVMAGEQNGMVAAIQKYRAAESGWQLQRSRARSRRLVQTHRKARCILAGTEAGDRGDSIWHPGSHRMRGKTELQVLPLLSAD